MRPSQFTLQLFAVAALGTVVACKGGGIGQNKSSDGGDKPADSTEKATDKDPNAPAPGGPAGVTPAEGNDIAVTGTLSLSGLSLQEKAPDKVLAFLVEAGQIRDGGATLIADINEKGEFGLKLPKVSPLLTAIDAGKRPDGTYDRAAIEKALHQPIPAEISDAHITEFAEQMRAEAERGGLVYVLVSMVSSGDRVAEAQSFRFIGLGAGDKILNGLPTKNAKGNLGLGKISGQGDQAKAELAADGNAFDLSTETIDAMASTSNTLKAVRNVWMNFHPDTGESYEPTPFYMWMGYEIEAVKNAYSTPAAATYNGMGLYLSARLAPFKFADVCSAANEGKLTLTPPVELDTGGIYGKINKERPFNNGGLTKINHESSRDNCGGTETGFYAAGREGDPDVMINWGTGGSIAGKTPEGLFDLAWQGTKLASFELASSSPFDAAGKPKVFIPAVKLTVDEGTGAVTRVDAKLFVWDGAAYKEADGTAFRSMVSSFSIELNESLGDGNRYDAGYSLLDNADGFYVEAPRLVNQHGKDGGSGEADKWTWLDSDSNDGSHVISSIAIYYEMFGSSYRVEFRDPSYVGDWTDDEMPEGTDESTATTTDEAGDSSSATME
jgi:hypothetical protein